MIKDKIRIRKELQSELEEWAQVLEISESEVVRDALKFYFKHLRGELIQSPKVLLAEPQSVALTQVENEEDYTGDIEL